MRKIVSLLWLVMLAAQMQAQIRGNNIVITVEPDHADWNYRVGETATFTVEVRRSGTLLPNVVVSYEAGPDMYPDVKKDNVTLKDGTLSLKGKLSKPGFYRVKVRARIEGKDYDATCNVGYDPDKLQPYTQCPADFDAFWKKALSEARQYDLDPQIQLMPERCTKDVDVYHVSFVNQRPGNRIYGILCKPKKAGSYPALLRVPGAGVRQYFGDVYTASQGAITLEIGIHGIPVNLDQSTYDRMLDGCLNGYWEVNLDEPEKNFYRRVVVGAVRSVDFIASLPEWNGKTVGVTGSSQGGFLSLATAALDSRITFYAPVHDAMCDYEAALHKSACGWPHYFYNVEKPDTKKVEGARYYDGVNFAKRIKNAKGWFSFGYNDDVVPPGSSYATYNAVPGPKQLSLYQQTGHFWYQEQWDEWEQFLLERLKD
ncbi:MAG: acetylxylan esterase [Prevotella sp.]|nr:acetylxylan esterase [Prevotella sp.]